MKNNQMLVFKCKKSVNKQKKSMYKSVQMLLMYKISVNNQSIKSGNMQPVPFSCICKKNQSIKISCEGGRR